MAFSFTHRKLLLSLTNTTNNNNNNIIPTVQTCLYFCNKLKNDTVSPAGWCPKPCLDICPSTCHYSLLPQYSNNNYSPSQTIRPHNLSPLLISMLTLLAIVFLIITFYVIYTKLCYHFDNFTPHRSNGGGEVMSEEHEGTMVFHPIWYIPTVGLNPTVINSIKVEKYEEGVKESDCAVCLGEFILGDDLRILPKCQHAFHVPCIDTWLGSHVTCPLCRTPIDPVVDSGCGRGCEVSTNVIRSNTSAGEDETPREEVRIAMDNNNSNSNSNNNLENNKGSSSQRWCWEREAARLVTRSLSCSGKIFSSRHNNNNNNNNNDGPSPNS